MKHVMQMELEDSVFSEASQQEDNYCIISYATARCRELGRSTAGTAEDKQLVCRQVAAGAGVVESTD